MTMSSLDQDDLDCSVTFDDVKAKLGDIEAQLATRLPVPRAVRAKLLSLCRTGRLDHDDLVDEWLATYATYMEFPPRRFKR